MEPKRPKPHLNPSPKRPKNATKPQAENWRNVAYGTPKKRKKSASSTTNLQAAGQPWCSWTTTVAQPSWNKDKNEPRRKVNASGVRGILLTKDLRKTLETSPLERTTESDSIAKRHKNSRNVAFGTHDWKMAKRPKRHRRNALQPEKCRNVAFGTH